MSLPISQPVRPDAMTNTPIEALKRRAAKMGVIYRVISRAPDSTSVDNLRVINILLTYLLKLIKQHVNYINSLILAIAYNHRGVGVMPVILSN